MSRLRDFGKDVACYFGFGDGSERSRTSRSLAREESDLGMVLRVAPPLIVTFALSRVLGFDDDLLGYVMTIGLLVPVGLVWELARRATAASRDV